MNTRVDPERVYLSGFMGAGKSTVGRVLAERLEWPFDDLDEVIEREENATIPEIFDERGEEAFRRLETSYLEEQSRRSAPFVLAVGGGAPLQSKNRAIMNATGIEVFLKVPFPVAFRRIKEDEHRPLVPEGPGAKTELRNLWQARKPVYLEADIVVDCGEKPPDRIAELVEEKLRTVQL